MSHKRPARVLEPLLVDRMVHVALWTAAVLTYGVGDVATTIFFLSTTDHAVEANPIARAAMDAVSVWIVVPWKAVVIALFYGSYRAAPREIRVGIPLGLAILGCTLTGWNLSVGLRALGVQ